MNVYHCFCESLYKCAYTASKAPTLFVYIFLYYCLSQFTLLVYKSSIMAVENFEKYHWIQHKNTQFVVVTSEPIERT